MGIERQLSLPYQRHSETSKATAKKEKGRQNAFKWEVLRIFDSYKNVIDEFVCECFPDVQPGTVRARRIGLVKEGYLKDSKLTRLTKSGNPATVWIRTDKKRPQ